MQDEKDEKKDENNQYSHYANEGLSVEIFTLKPSVRGFIRKYLLCFSPVIAVGLYILFSKFVFPATLNKVQQLIQQLIPEFFLSIPSWVLDAFGIKIPDTGLYLPVLGFIIFLLIISWALSSTEASGSIGLAIFLTFVVAAVKTYPLIENKNTFVTSFLSNFNAYIIYGAIAATLILLLRTEIYRKSISYTLRSADLAISGGIWRKQEQNIPYDQIGRLVLEQSLIGRKLDYGTIIPVGVAEWGAEYYTRAVGVQSTGVAVGYARTLKEMSRDPMKCLYGLRNPQKVLEMLQKRITVPYRAEIDQVKYLRKIAEEGHGETT